MHNCAIESRLLKKCKWLLIRDNEFYFFKNENTVHLQPMNVKGRYCLSIDDFECFKIPMQMLFLNVPYALMKVILVLISVY